MTTTTTTTTTLADLAATSLNAIRILEHHGLDYCCGGKQPFREACLARGVKPEAIIREIEEAKTATVAGRDWQTAPLYELVKHIVGTHHEYLKQDLHLARPCHGNGHVGGERASAPGRQSGPGSPDGPDGNEKCTHCT